MKLRLGNFSTQSKLRSSAFTLLEVLVTAGVGSVLLAAVGALSMFTARSFVAAGNYADLDRASRKALDIMSREVRQSLALTAYTTNKLTLTDIDNATLIFEYDTSTKKLTRQKTNTTIVLLTECDY